jgi:hypothetical protein
MTGIALLLTLSSGGGRIGQKPCAAAMYEFPAVRVACGARIEPHKGRVALRETVASRLSVLLFGWLLQLATISSAQSQPNGRAPEIAITPAPGRPFIEMRGDQQHINFDLLVRTGGQRVYRLVCIRLRVYDRSGGLEIEQELNENGKPPALDMVGDRLLQPGSVMDIYQPFDSFGPEVDASMMRFELLFMEQEHAAPPVVINADATAMIEVHPRSYSPTAYCLPLHGLILVHDGHDFYSHHRRYGLANRFEVHPSSAVSANLYAYDFMAATPDGALFRGDATKKESWLAYGTMIFAPASGQVVDAVSDVPENTFAVNGDAQVPSTTGSKDPMGFGNHVTIRHEDGRVSWLLHMQPNSVQVKAGDQVKAGQFLGRIGFSGDSLFPHLHFNVTDGAMYPSQGVPSYFKHFVRILGRRKVSIVFGQVDTGDLIMDATRPCR